MATVKKNALVLDVAAIEEDFFEDASIYGLRFAEEAYYCAWFLNTNYGTRFVRNKQFFLTSEQGYDLYEFYDPKTSLEHLLYTNQKQGNYMMRELRGYHFFWIVKGEDYAYIFMNDLLAKMKKDGIGIEIQSIDIDKITNKSLFIF
jgi:hypothetical protein